MYNLVSFLGVFILMFTAWLFSTNRKVINWRVVVGGLGIQLIFAFFIFVIPVGARFFLFLNNVVLKVIESATAGSRFLFGRLALPPGATDEFGQESLGFILAFQALPTIIFFSSLMALLYHLRVLPWLVGFFARIFTRLMRISGAESLCAASNIFVGVESATTVRPFLERMTRSELCTVLSVGMASIASNVMALYVFILQGQFPTIAGHLISASLLSAPAAVVISKLMVPETGEPVTLGKDVEPFHERSASSMTAIIRGANDGVKLIVGIAALLIAVLGLLALFDMFLFAVAGTTISEILGFVFYPFALVIGVPLSDAMEIARLIGERVVATEVKSYQSLAVLIADGRLVHPRSAFLAAYALCGFAHFASLAIFVGGISALVPSRIEDLSSVGFRALVAATLACLMTAAVAGTFFSKGSILLGG